MGIEQKPCLCPADEEAESKIGAKDWAMSFKGPLLLVPLLLVNLSKG